MPPWLSPGLFEAGRGGRHPRDAARMRQPCPGRVPWDGHGTRGAQRSPAWKNQNQNLHPAHAQQGPQRHKSHPEDGAQLSATPDPCRVLAAAPSSMPRRRPRSVPRHGHGALTATICQARGQTPQNPNPNPAQAAGDAHSRKGLRPPWLRCRYQRHDNRLEIFGGRERSRARDETAEELQ